MSFGMLLLIILALILMGILPAWAIVAPGVMDQAVVWVWS